MKSIIAAVDEKYGIGKNGVLPWHLPEDLKRFKELTNETICIMGYNTYKEIADRFRYEETGKFLPKRLSYIITSKDIPVKNGFVERYANIPEALESAQKNYPDKDIFFIGGARIFKEAASLVDRFYLTIVDGDFNCDVFFPKETLLEEILIDISMRQKFDGFTFVTLEKL